MANSEGLGSGVDSSMETPVGSTDIVGNGASVFPSSGVGSSSQPASIEVAMSIIINANRFILLL